MIPFLYRGLIKCAECRATISYEIQKSHGYLRCSKKLGPCTQPYLRADRMSEQMTEMIGAIVLPAACLSELNRLYHEHRINEKAEEVKRRQALEDMLLTLKQEQALLLKHLLAGILTESEYREAKEDSIGKLIQIREEIAELDSPRTGRLEPIEEVLQRLNEAVKIEHSTNEKEKLEFLKNVGSNFELGGRRVNLKWKEPFGVAAEWKTRHVGDGKKPVQQDTNELWLTVSGTLRMKKAPLCSERVGFELKRNCPLFKGGGPGPNFRDVGAW